MSEVTQGQALLSVEAEAYIEALETFRISEIGGEKWTRQHERIEKLNMQAVISASQNEEEFVKECLTSLEKIPVLIHELLATELWKQKIFDEFVSMNFEPKTTFPVYMVLYHEATVANLLETVLYHREACESAEDVIIDLVDYTYRKLTAFTAKKDDEEEIEAKKSIETSNLQELIKQNQTLEFDINIKAVSILRYIIDHLNSLPLSVMSRMLNTLDIPILLVEMIENPPWSKNVDGKYSKYIDGKWQTVDYQDMFKLTKLEGQVWLSAYQLLMDENCQKKYELESYRKNTILKLRSYLTEVMLDQLPVLAELQRYLEHLSMMEPQPIKRDILLEQVPEIRDRLMKENEGKWRTIAKKQAKTHFSLPDSLMREQAKRWADTYNLDMLEGLITEPPKCALCGEQATKRCSRCQNEWYCRRECQVKHWSKHKQACNLMQENLQKPVTEAVKT